MQVPDSEPRGGPLGPAAGTCRRCGASAKARLCDGCLAEDAEHVEVSVQPIVLDARYEIERELGEGSMGLVYHARDVDLDRPVAIKTLDEDFAVDAEAVERVRAEARAIAKIRHDNVVQVYTFRATPEACFIAMELVFGESLEHVLDAHSARGAFLSIRDVVEVLRKVIDGLTAVHSAGVVHRDVKPANIVVEEHTGRPVLIDFGLATPARSATKLAGSPAYMAPELLGDGNAAAASVYSDIYALGCTMFELLTGSPPFEADSVRDLLVKHTNEVPRSVSSLNPSAQPFDDVVARALQKLPENRFQRCDELGEALEEAFSRWVQQEEAATKSEERKTRAKPHREVRILVVDDDDDFAKLCQRAVQVAYFQRPIQVMRCKTADDAIDAGASFRPQLVLLDHDLAGSDGVDVLTALRSLPDGESMRVIVVSGKAGSYEQFRYAALGVSAFVAKPIAFTALVEMIVDISTGSGLLQVDAALA